MSVLSQSSDSTSDDDAGGDEHGVTKSSIK